MKKQIQEDVREAMKAGDEIKKDTLRMLLASLINKEKEKGKEELSEEEAQQVLVTEAKKRKEAAEAFAKAGKEEMATKEEQELKILQAYLPEQLSEDEVRKLVQEAIEKSGAQSAQDIGKVMGILMPHVKGKADGALVSSVVKYLLG